MKTTSLRTRRRAFLTIGLLLGMGVSAWAQSSNVTVYATGLEYPRGLKFGPNGLLYVAEAGAGGSMSTQGMCDQVVPPIGPYTGGFTGRVSSVDSNGKLTTVVDSLPSAIDSMGDVVGPADVAFVRNHLFVLLSAGCSHGFSNIPSEIIRVYKDATTTEIANLSAFQMSHPVKNPNQSDFEPDGTWYSMVTAGNLIFAVEPNHGELDRIHTNGKIGRILDVSAYYGHVVPTAVAYNGIDFFVGNLGTFPINDGSEFILKVDPQGNQSIFATGFTTILGLAFDSQKNLYVLENTTGAGNQFPTPGTGMILRLNKNGSTDTIATGLNLPTAMTFGSDGNLYVSAWGFGPPGMGEIDKVTIP